MTRDRQSQDHIQDRQGRYFTVILNMADDDLDPYQYRLLGHYLRVGNCWQSTRTTAEICQMSTGKVVSTRYDLERLGYISLTPHESGTYRILLLDRMAENVARYQRGAL